MKSQHAPDRAEGPELRAIAPELISALTDGAQCRYCISCKVVLQIVGKSEVKRSCSVPKRLQGMNISLGMCWTSSWAPPSQRMSTRRPSPLHLGTSHSAPSADVVRLKYIEHARGLEAHLLKVRVPFPDRYVPSSSVPSKNVLLR